MTPAELSAAIIRILSALQSSGRLSAVDLPAEVVIERPKNREHGDWATNVAMQLAGKFGMNPRAFAEMLAPELEVLDGVAKVDIAGPGFINITFSAAAAGEAAKTIVEAGAAFGRGTDMAGIKLWVPHNDTIAIRTFEAAGISPIPLPIGDVFTSLQTGMVDTVANTPSGAIALQWHGKLSHMVDLPLTFVVGYLVLDEKAWKRLSPADQQVFAKAFGEAAARMDATVQRDNLAALEALKKQGLSVNTLAPEEAARWRAAGCRSPIGAVPCRALSASFSA